MTIELPKEVRVGYALYRIEAFRHDGETADGKLGDCDRVIHTIRVRPDLPASQVANTLLHEILHAAYDIADLPAKHEEKVVSGLARVLTQIAQDSPEVLRWIIHTAELKRPVPFIAPKDILDAIQRDEPLKPGAIIQKDPS